MMCRARKYALQGGRIFTSEDNEDLRRATEGWGFRDHQNRHFTGNIFSTLIVSSVHTQQNTENTFLASKKTCSTSFTVLNPQIEINYSFPVNSYVESCYYIISFV